MAKQTKVAKQPVEKIGEKTGVKKTEDKAAEVDKFNLDFAQGYERGFKAGVDSRPDTKNIQRIAFDEGVRHIVTLAENFLVKELELPNLEALAKSGKIPAWWIATLVTNFAESPKESKSFE